MLVLENLQHLHERIIVEHGSKILYYHENSFEYFHGDFWPHRENSGLISMISLATGPLHILLPLIRTALFLSTNSSFFFSLRIIFLRKASLISFKKSCFVMPFITLVTSCLKSFVTVLHISVWLCFKIIRLCLTIASHVCNIVFGSYSYWIIIE